MYNTKQFLTLLSAGAVDKIEVRGVSGGFFVMVNNEVLALDRESEPRRFKKLTAAADYLRARGVAKFDVDLTHYQPNQTTIAFD